MRAKLATRTCLGSIGRTELAERRRRLAAMLARTWRFPAVSARRFVRSYGRAMQLPDAAPMALWPPLLAVQGEGDASEAHSHRTIHAVIARRGTLSIRIGGATHRAAGVRLRS